jgi:hypothetical protein
VNTCSQVGICMFHLLRFDDEISLT